MLATPSVALSCLVLLSSLSHTVSQHLGGASSEDPRHQRLAVLLPTPPSGRHDGQWPTGCSPAGKTTQKVDLVLYMSPLGGFVGAGAQPTHQPQSHCFARVRTVFGPEVSARR